MSMKERDDAARGDPMRRIGPEVSCPACGKRSAYDSANPWRPFCSERCKVIDLGAWASEQYRIAGTPEESPPEDDSHDSPR